MAEDDAAPTAEEFSAWITPGDAVKALTRRLDTRTAILTIFDRLKFGLIRAVAGTQIFRNARSERVPINKSTWAHAVTGIAVSPFWATGDITIPLQAHSPAYGYQEFPLALFGVRFNPAGVQELLPAAPDPVIRSTGSAYAPQPIDPPPDTPAAPALDEAPEPTKGPRVSDALLKDWYALYKRAYPASSDTEAMAIRSAEGMFPGKSVARRRIRDMRGPQKRGKKPSEPDN